MSAPIFAIDEGGSLVRMESAPYATEELLQRLIADYPDVLHDANSAVGEPRRWLLITREAGIPDTTGGSGRWSVDHLLLDQDGVPTFVEVKRSTDTRIRREVVGQMLDYAANALLHWPVSDIQAMFLASCQERGQSPEDTLREYLGEVDPESYWDAVASHLGSRTVRLLFVADVIPVELQRIIEFLNDQLRYADVLGVEVQQYMAPGGQLQVLVPRVIGRTARAADVKAPRARGGRAWDEESFFAALDGTAIPFSRALLEWARAHDVDVSWGTGATYGTMRLRTDAGGQVARLTGMDTSGKMLWEPAALADVPPFDSEGKRLEIVRRLNAVPGVDLPEKIVLSSWAHISPQVLRDPAVHEPLLTVLSWLLEELRTASVLHRED